MRVKIDPAYLGFSAGQSKRSRQRGITRKVWVMKDGIRIRISKLNDQHLVRIALLLDGYAKRVKYNARKISSQMNLFETVLVDEGNFNTFESLLYDDIANWSKVKILQKTVACFPELVKEGYKRGLLHSSGFPNQVGLSLVGLGKEKDIAIVK